MYVIASDSPLHPGTVIFMVDRRKQHKSFWSNSTEDVFTFADRDSAVRKARKLQFNNPRVLTLGQANRISAKQQQERETQK